MRIAELSAQGTGAVLEVVVTISRTDITFAVCPPEMFTLYCADSTASEMPIMFANLFANSTGISVPTVIAEFSAYDTFAVIPVVATSL